MAATLKPKILVRDFIKMITTRHCEIIFSNIDGPEPFVESPVWGVNINTDNGYSVFKF